MIEELVQRPVSTTKPWGTQEKGRQIKDFMGVFRNDGMVVLKYGCSTLKFLLPRYGDPCSLLFNQGGLITVSADGIL